MSSPAGQLLAVLRGYVSDWDHNFKVEVEERDEESAERVYLGATVTFLPTGRRHHLNFCFGEEMCIEMGEDCYTPLTSEMFWAWLYLDAAWSP